MILDAGADYVAAADAVLALLTDLDDDQRSRLSVDLGADPLTAPLSGRSAPSIADVVATAGESHRIRRRGARDHHRRPGVPQPGCQRVVGARRCHRSRGRLPAAARRGGMAVPDALRQISFRFAADDDQFMTIAKLRAARQLWARVAEVVGEPTAGAATVHAVTSLPMMAQRDPWVNMLRTTLAAFSAGVGGADTVLVHPFDVAIPGGFPGIAPGLSRRHRAQHPTAAAGGIPHRAGARPRRRIVVRRGPHRAAGRTGVEALPGHRIPRRVRRGRRLRRRADRRGARPPDRRHRAPAHGADRCQRVPKPGGTAAAPDSA